MRTLYVFVIVLVFGSAKKYRDDSSEVDEVIQMLIDRLQLLEHPVDGFFVESWRSDRKVIVADPNLAKVQDLASNIYFLLREQEVDKWHKGKQAQVFYWHAGGTLQVHTIDQTGELKTALLGDMLENANTSYQVFNDPHIWVALEPEPNSVFVLFGVVSLPAFEFVDWELGNGTELKQQFPQHADIIDRLS